MFERDFDKEPLTKEEFIDGIMDAMQDMADPDGDFNSMVEDFRAHAKQVSAFDPTMSGKMLAVVSAFEDFGTYVKSRAEFLSADSTKTGG